MSDPAAGAATAVWVFGYGSLIWKADFPYLERRRARLDGWSRRFWQGSHDHRGTPDAPGRVLTLVAEAGASCVGVAYRVEHSVFGHLDHREKNGYTRIESRLDLDDGQTVDAMVYLAAEGNEAFLGPADDEAIVRQIARARGPSGANRDYLLHLARALRELGTQDEHVHGLERRLLALSGPAEAPA